MSIVKAKKRNVIFISKFFYPHIGGVEKHILEVSKDLQKLGYKVTVVTEKYDPCLSGSEEYKGIKIIRFIYPHIKILGLFYIWFWFLIRGKELFKKNNIIHVHDVFLWILPHKIFKLFPKVFLTIHGWEGSYPIPIKNIVIKKISVLFATKTIVVGHYIEKYYGIYGDLIIYGASRRIRYKNFRKKPNDIIFLGRLEKDTGILELLSLKDILRKHKVQLTFCGDGILRERCEQIGQVVGFVRPEEYLKKANICICSGYLSAIEALKYNCLVIGFWNNPIRHDYFRLSPFNKYIKLVNSASDFDLVLNDLLSQKKLAERMRKIGKEWADEQTWLFTTRSYIKLWTSD